MAQRTDWIDTTKLDTLNNDVHKRGSVDREHILDFLKSVDTSDADVIVAELRKWLQTLNDNPKYSKVIFSQDDIDAIIGDLDSYGFVQSLTILKFKEDSKRNIV